MANDDIPKRNFFSQDSYVLRTIVENVPIAIEGRTSKPHITCVQLWGQSFPNAHRVPLNGINVLYSKSNILIGDYGRRG